MGLLTKDPEPISIMGVKVVPFDSYAHAVDCIEEKIQDRQKCFCVAINPEKVYRAGQDSKLWNVLDEANLGICDGIGVALASWILYGRRLRRCTGVDLFYQLVARASERGWKVFLLGASPESNEGTYRRLHAIYPGLQLVGRQDGFFQDSEKIVDAINNSGADLVFVAMGSPRQEFWISEQLIRLEVPFCMGVGGTFDVISGKARRAPAIFRRTGTEFLYRLLCNPSRWRRQVVLPLFLFSVLRHRFHTSR